MGINFPEVYFRIRSAEVSFSSDVHSLERDCEGCKSCSATTVCDDNQTTKPFPLTRIASLPVLVISIVNHLANSIISSHS